MRPADDPHSLIGAKKPEKYRLCRLFVDSGMDVIGYIHVKMKEGLLVHFGEETDVDVQVIDTKR